MSISRLQVDVSGVPVFSPDTSVLLWLHAPVNSLASTLPALFEFADLTFQPPPPAPVIASTQRPVSNTTHPHLCQRSIFSNFLICWSRSWKYVFRFNVICTFLWVGWASPHMFKSHLNFMCCEQSAHSLGPCSVRLLKLIIHILAISSLSQELSPLHQPPPDSHLSFSFRYAFCYAKILKFQVIKFNGLFFYGFWILWNIQKDLPCSDITKLPIWQWFVLILAWSFLFYTKIVTHVDPILWHDTNFESHSFSRWWLHMC